MKRIRLLCFLLLFIILVFMFSSATAETASSTNYDLARGTANFMEDHYDDKIFIGDECESVITSGFEIGSNPVGRTPLLNLLSYTDYEEEIESIDDCFSIYPGGFFTKFRCPEAEHGLRILLPNRILVKGETIAGVTTIQDGYYNIFLGVGAFNNLNVHHEIWHAMEYRITLDNPDAFADWSDLNPEGFTYDEEYFQEDLWTYAKPKDDYFVRGYSVVNEMEDRATVIEAIFAEYAEWWAEHPMIQRKLDALMKVMEPVFGRDVYFQE